MSSKEHLLVKSTLLTWRMDGLLSFLLGTISLLLYIRTLLPGVLPNDGAEFQTLAFTLDHAHTTGYHLYLILAHLFLSLPLSGDVAYRVNLFSAVMGSVTVIFLYLVAKLLTGNTLAAAITAVMLSISSTFWSQSIIAEVYTSGTACTSALLFVILSWQNTRKNIYIFIAALLGILGIGLHGSVILLGPAVLFLVILNLKNDCHAWKAVVAGSVFGVILFFVAFTVIDSHQTNASMMNTYTSSASRWDMIKEDLDTPIERFVFLVSGRQWRPMMFLDGIFTVNTRLFLQFLSSDFSLPVLLFLLAGLVSLWRFKRKLACFFIIAILSHLAYILNYGIGDIYVFFLSVYLIMLPLSAEGLSVFLAILRQLPLKRRPLVNSLLVAAVFMTCLPPDMVEKYRSLRDGEFRESFMNLPTNQDLDSWHKMIRLNVNDLPKNAVVLSEWYEIYAYAYSAHVELNRSDLLFIEAYPFAYNKTSMADSLLAFIDRKLENGYPVFARSKYDDILQGGFNLISQPIGVTEMFQIVKPGNSH